MKKNLLTKILLFVGLAFLALILVVKGKPRPKDLNPVKKIAEGDIVKLSITNPPDIIVLEKDGSTWKMLQPVTDQADPSAAEQIISGLKRMSIGSIVSETDTNYAQFELDEARARHLQVFVKNQKDPLFDGYVGKQAQTMGSAYFRFQNKKPVHFINDFQVYLLSRIPQEYRVRPLVPLEVEKAEFVQVEGDKLNFGLQFSSPTWTRTDTKEIVNEGWATEVRLRIKALQAARFGIGTETNKETGFDKPYLKITVKKGDVTKTAFIGNLLAKKEKTDLPMCYAKTEGREAILIVYNSFVEELTKYIKTDKSYLTKTP